MPLFETPQPISVSVDIAVGDVRLSADDRTDTVVEVRPGDPGNEADTKAAESTRVEYAGGRLTVRGPKPLALVGRPGSVDIMIDLPSGSEVSGSAQTGSFRSSGRVGPCRVRTSTGDIHLGDTGPLVATTSVGDVTADRVDGSAEVTTGAGSVRIGALTGSAVVKNANGENWIGEATGKLQVRANGAITVDKAHATLEAKTARGDIRVGEVVRGTVVLATSRGALDIGIGAGTAARLDVRTKSGAVHNFLTASDGPGEAQETVEVHASTSVGDISVRRA